MATLEKLQAKIAKLQVQAEAIAKSQSSTVIAKIRDLMGVHGLTVADIDAYIGGRRGHKPTGAKVAGTLAAAKYLDPKTGATWTGHGRAPSWIANAKDRSKFLVDGGSERTTTGVKKVAKPGNYVRGPQAPKYRNPATGATWSGRGPAPAWLASAKDRTAFLIDGADQGGAEPKATAARKALAKKVAGKKVASKKVATKNVAAKKNAAPAKKSPAKKSAVKRAVTKKTAAKKVTAAVEVPQASMPANGAAGESTAA
ncbi:H-NS histone family protein [Paraburkholderia sp. CNPSo 3157]|uniref:H-NS histone family protein n=2 Tax=Paraburkholderia franconis TaxID=2654983 RepID=A0A7X1TLQ4_9BURK|nr:H-NS histone family protein [Paraburkholderia franconis]MPW24012.1 H-NS histone family protein [Paraburkholderia franconis]